ncbi:RT0821/Lpp0805 family surface protein [uncultured Nitratireductor sp.]|uniref:RT0821/Lpp0805 family surface protein n=1 Tax=uncultured Nitratireductor sp. TaxID=520953 RepID=UPI0025CDB65D|nr:RT0821/Lpp0805 family surface protein [uncultured Nitratireductor sp.]
MKLAPVFAVALCAVLSGCLGAGMSGSQLEPSQFASTRSATDSSAILGIEGGGLVGGDLGDALSRRQKRLAIEAEYKALENTPAGQDVSWQDAGSGRSGTVRAAQPYRVGSQDCRQYTHTVQVNGTPRESRGTACRNEDGSWMLLG